MATPLTAVTAVNRFGLGAKAGELARAKSDPRAWLTGQIEGTHSVPDAIASLPPSNEVFMRFTEAQESKREVRNEQQPEPRDTAPSTGQPPSPPPAQAIIQGVRKVLQPIYLQQVAARYQVAGATDEPFRERLIHFWSNHFAVSVDKIVVLGLAAGLENEAVRANLNGRFIDMLLAVEQHPAMILYLDNQQSSGPNSQLAKLAERRRPNADRKIGINENLAREILELHTLGVQGGYTQPDVTTFAQALTGWSVGGRGPGNRGGGQGVQGAPGEFLFREGVHEPGAKIILGKSYGEEGYGQAKAVLVDLAKHPATAKFIATKLVRHFVSDEPPAAAVDKVAKTFRDSDGHLPTVHRAVVELTQAWDSRSIKLKTPHEFIVSSVRGLDVRPKQPQQILTAFDALGQRPYSPGSPAGWPDSASNWDGPDALMKRIEWTTGLAQRADARVVPLELAAELLGATLGDHTRTSIARAASGAQALTLLLMSPEFQRR